MAISVTTVQGITKFLFKGGRENSLPSQLFVNILYGKNIGLFTHKKDKCDTCCAYKAANIDDKSAN